MHTLHFIPNLEQGGAERMLVELTRADTTNRHTVVTLFDGPHQFTGEVRGTVLSLGTSQRSAPRNFLRMRQRAQQILDQMAPDLVVGWLYLATPFAALGKAVDARVAFSIHATDLDLGKGHHYTKWARCYARWAAGSARCDVLHYCSVQGQMAHEAFGFAPEKSAYVPNAIDTARFKPLALNDPRRTRRPNRDGGEDGLFQIACAARFHPQKDHDTLLHAIALLKQRGMALRCTLAGRACTVDNDQLRALIARYDLSDVVDCVGPISDMPALYSSVDVTVLSSAYGESMPLVLLEALATNCPVVATDIGACRELVGPHGQIVPPQNANALAEAIWTVAHAPPSELSNARRDHVVQNYGMERFVSDWHRKINNDHRA